MIANVMDGNDIRVLQLSNDGRLTTKLCKRHLPQRDASVILAINPRDA